MPESPHRAQGNQALQSSSGGVPNKCLETHIEEFYGFLLTLSKQDLAIAEEQLQQEKTARTECDNNILRLMFSTLTDEELV
ncbi:MAG TPA: hypothetical protein VKU01_24450 [Bryobacteraceae bacterium]|nr:hypothetical protein [Bryobacteraceae bacterium]